MQIGFLFERFALRAVGASCFLAALSVASNFTFSAAMSDDELGLPADAVSVVFDLADLIVVSNLGTTAEATLDAGSACENMREYARICEYMRGHVGTLKTMRGQVSSSGRMLRHVRTCGLVRHHESSLLYVSVRARVVRNRPGDKMFETGESLVQTPDRLGARPTLGSRFELGLTQTICP